MDQRVDRLFKLNAPDLQPLFVRASELLAWVGASVLVGHCLVIYLLLNPLYFPLECFFFLLLEFGFNVAGE